MFLNVLYYKMHDRAKIGILEPVTAVSHERARLDRCSGGLRRKPRYPRINKLLYEVSRKKGTHCNEEEGRFVHLDPGHADDGYALAVVRR